MTANDAIDRKAIEEMLESTGGDPEFVVEIIDDYLADTLMRFDELSSALSANDSAAAKLAAHSVKGSSRSFGALRLSNLAAGLEKLSLESKLETIGEQLPELRSELERVTDALRAEQSRLREAV